MATGHGKSELRRRLSAALPGALTALLVALLAAPAGAQYEPSGYAPFAGEPFFLLSDRSWSTTDTALVRLEVATPDFGLQEVEAYGGVDVVVYRVPRPMEFLKAQKNLHRIKVTAVDADEGLSNALSHVWDRWMKASRLAWRKIFSSDARQAVTREAPELKTSPSITAPTQFRHPPQFRPIKGLDLVERFRYPVHRATSIAPPKGVELAGSSSSFITRSEGNVMIPIGKREPGLYVVEAYVGSYRAQTLAFVSDTVAVTKSSSGEVLVWAAHRTSGAPVSGVEVVWTDGTGVLQSGRTDDAGLVRLLHEAPEKSTLLGEDADGGVFVSESFYYDSEIYDAKVYAVTDRPLYRPGDEVFVKFFGREFRSARESVPLAPGPVALTVMDPNGAPVASQKLQVTAADGGHTSFRLPDSATGGGYELRFTYKDGLYAAAFRVAEYQKPHFEITLVPDKPAFKTGEEISGRFQLHYPDGKPVAFANVQLGVRAQQMTMVDGELGYYGQFPVKLSSESLTTDAQGEARFTMPAADKPSRYVLTAFATDGAAYRVKTTRELLVERSPGAFSVRADRRFSAPQETVSFTVIPQGEVSGPPVRWEWIRLEDQMKTGGPLSAGRPLQLAFAEPGSYTVQLRDTQGNVVGATPHWVSGGSVKAPAGSITLVASQDKCKPGDVVDVLVTFSTPVEEALLTLERDRVEETTLLTRGPSWVETTRLTPTQWRARLHVTEAFAPNITFSVATVKDGEDVFQNQGLQVARPKIDVLFRTDKPVYAPGETVKVSVDTRVNGRGVPATVAVGVVDEMIYVLQPEIAPDVYDFFHHARRNNVRTSSSLSFISYDLAVSRSKSAPEPHSVNERRVKVLERPRRDDVDTAYWQPTLRTGPNGRASFTFVMPDSLTRWRLTGRAVAADGTVGQRSAWVRSDKELYVKWTSPTWMRSGDAPVASLAAFNRTEKTQAVDFVVSGPGIARTEKITLAPGANFVAQPLRGLSDDGDVQVSLVRSGKVVDALLTRLTRQPPGWRSPRTVRVELAGPRTPLALPADARNVRLTLASTAAAYFNHALDDLIEYPYGCVEQTASRMIPFSLALTGLGPDAERVGDRLRQQLNGQRLRLAYLAGPKARFTWWGAGTADDPFLTAYAYYADWTATRALGTTLPDDHWNRLLDVYSEGGHTLPFAQRALVLLWMQEMKLPVRGLAQGLLDDMAKAPAEPVTDVDEPLGDSVLLAHPDGTLGRAFALAVADRLAAGEKMAWPAPLESRRDLAWGVLASSGTPVARALLIASGRREAREIGRVLEDVRAEMPTLERALALAWIDRALAARTKSETAPGLEAPWEKRSTATGQVVWHWPSGKTAPREVGLLQPPGASMAAIVQFDSAAPEEGHLPVQVERRLYRVTRDGDVFAREPVEPGTALSTNELYLDEVTVTPDDAAMRYALLEAPLPPGGAVESTTWGIEFAGEDDKTVALERARHQPMRDGYVVPLDPLEGQAVVRHLLRFAQKGSYLLPPARVYRMYQPDRKALETTSDLRKVEVQ